MTKSKKINYCDNICLIGLGYVGIPLLKIIAKSLKPKNLIGLDIDLKKIELLKKSVNPLTLKKDDLLKNITFTDSYNEVDKCNVFIITVPTPLNKHKAPEYFFFNTVINNLNKLNLSKKLISIETTLSVGDIEIAHKKLLKKNKNVHVVYSPEREDPGNKNYNINNISKIISSDNLKSLDIGHNFYKKFIKNLIKTSSTKEAELTKLLENSYRLVNISFINEFKTICQKYDVNVNNVIKLASTKPFGFTKFNPSIGAGGHCIPVDPVYLTHKLGNSSNSKYPLLSASIDFNENLPQYYFKKLSKLIKKKDYILFVGLSYKDGIPDIRESKSLELALLFKKNNFVNFFYTCIKDYKIKDLKYLNSQNSPKKFKHIIITKKIKFDINQYISKNTIVHSFIELNSKKLNTTKVIYH